MITCIFVIPYKWSFSFFKIKMWPRCSFCEVLKNMLQCRTSKVSNVRENIKHQMNWNIKPRVPSHYQAIPYSDALALSSSTHPSKDVKTFHSQPPTTCHILWNSVMWNMLKVDWYNISQKKRSIVPRITSSRTCLPLPLSTTTVVFGSLHSAVKGCLSFGCTLSSISLIWSPVFSTGSVKVPLNPCSVYHQCWEKMLIQKFIYVIKCRLGFIPV